jgi:predicted metal-dependent HD superfamily phosphohydrolase
VTGDPPRRSSNVPLADLFRAYVLPSLRHQALTGTADQRVDLEIQLALLEREIRRVRTTLEDVRNFDTWMGEIAAGETGTASSGRTH